MSNEAGRLFFNDDEQRLLKRHGISRDEVFDGRGLPRRYVKEELDHYGFRYYVGTPCRSGGHRIRSKGGHCIACSPAAVAFQDRSDSAGSLYVAQSATSNLIKVGSTATDPGARMEDLNRQGYAARCDWRLVDAAWLSTNCGRKEFRVHGLLANWREPITCVNTSGYLVVTRETFNCSIAVALKAFRAVVESS